MNGKDGRRLARFDWWQSSVINADHETVLRVLREGVELSSVYPSTARHGYLYGAEVRLGDRVHARVWWGGNPGVHVQASGDTAPGVSRIVQGAGVEFGWVLHVTRADACLDWRMKGLFDLMAGKMIAYAKEKGIKINQQGDWARGESRTLYLGARSSACQLVLYEKGYEQQDDDKTWVRMEARAYPKKQAKALAGYWAPFEVFQVSWIPDLLASVGFDEVESYAIGTVWRKSDTERARAALLRQYRAVLKSWSDELGGWDRLGAAVAEGIAEQDVQAEKMRAASEGFRVGDDGSWVKIEGDVLVLHGAS